MLLTYRMLDDLPVPTGSHRDGEAPLAVVDSLPLSPNCPPPSANSTFNSCTESDLVLSRSSRKTAPVHHMLGLNASGAHHGVHGAAGSTGSTAGRPTVSEDSSSARLAPVAATGGAIPPVQGVVAAAAASLSFGGDPLGTQVETTPLAWRSTSPTQLLPQPSSNPSSDEESPPLLAPAQARHEQQQEAHHRQQRRRMNWRLRKEGSRSLGNEAEVLAALSLAPRRAQAQTASGAAT